MKLPSIHRTAQPLAALALASLSTLIALGQPTAPDPALLAQYDANHNGRLDPDELAAIPAAKRTAIPVTRAESAPPDEEVLVMSPFEVQADNNGYYAANTLSGTRLNSKIEDLGASISIVTKEQMNDFAMLDINDVFLHEANTEGTGNYTAFEVDRFGNVLDGVQNDPNNANRVRGLGPANTASGNFQTSGRAPIDPINIDAVEVSRGPNSSIFGLGNSSGTVNVIPATARLAKDSTQVQLRADSYGGSRASIDVNKVLQEDRLAIRASAVVQHDAYVRKPSGADSRRYNVMLQAHPFKWTTIRVGHEYYDSEATRANSVTPRDAITGWMEAGSPTWDPVTYTIHTAGQPDVVLPLDSRGRVPTAPAGLFSSGFIARPTLFVDQNGLGAWTVSQTTNTNDPSTANQAVRYLESGPSPVRTVGGALFSTDPGLTDRSLYDWSDINLSAINAIHDNVKTTRFELDQFLLQTDHQMIAAQLGWFRETAARQNYNVIGNATSASVSGFLQVDINERLIDGSPNPYFLRPYIGVGEPLFSDSPLTRDIYRGQLAYQVDFTDSKGWSKWLGKHQVSAYAEYKDTIQRNYNFRDAMADDHNFIADGAPRGNQGSPAGPVVARGYYRYYVGDNSGHNVDYAPTAAPFGTSSFRWYDGSTGQWVTENAELGRVASMDGSAGTRSSRVILKTEGAVIQSHLLKDHVVTTIGRRKDEIFTRFGQTPVLTADGLDFDYAQSDKFVDEWLYRDGITDTAGVVVKTWPWLSFHANRSDSFLPEVPAQNILLESLPNPTGEGNDYGFSLNLLDSKLILRYNQYSTKQLNSRSGQSAIYATRTIRMDFNGPWGNDRHALMRVATGWIAEEATNLGVTYTQDQIDQRLTEIMGLSPATIQAFQDLPITETSDVEAKGKELEVFYNPNRNWTLKLNIAQQQTIDSNLSPNIGKWIEERMPIWTTVANPNNPAEVWWTSVYSGTVPRDFLAGVVTAPLALVQANEGKSRPQIREWRANLSTNFNLNGVTDHKIWKNVNIGGAVRWEDQAAIGYYGLPPTTGTQYTAFDPNRPIYDGAHTYVDLFVGYRTKLFNDKVHAKFQLNIQNLQQSGSRLQAVGAYPDGTGHSFRIIDPRKFILTTTFEL